MLELTVSISSAGAVKCSGYEQLLSFGYTKNRGIYRLNVFASGEWSGLAIRAFWHVPGGKDPASSLVVDGCVEVPASVTAQPGFGCITFEGTDGTRTVTSADLRYRVGANSGTEDGTAPEPGTDSWEQFVEAVKDNAEKSEQAKDAAEEAARQAGQALRDTAAAKTDALTAIKNAKNEAEDTVADAAKPALDAAQAAKESASESAQSASAAASSAGKADKSAQDANASAVEATRQAELAAQSAEGKGYLYLDDHDNSGTLSLVIADSITDEITLRDNGAGVLEVVYK